MLLSLADQICVHIVPYSPLLVVPYQLGLLLLLSLAEVLVVIGAGSRSQIVSATPNSQPCLWLACLPPNGPVGEDSI